MARGLTWEKKQRQNHVMVVLSGELNEAVDLSTLESLEGSVTFDLAGIRRINSGGARCWLRFMRTLDKVTELRMVRCSTAFVAQCNLIRGFEGKGTIESVLAPYRCHKTGEEDERLLYLGNLEDPLAPPDFLEDDDTYEFDEDPARFFAFLIDRRRRE